MKKLITLFLLICFLGACSPRYETVGVSWLPKKHKPPKTDKLPKRGYTQVRR